MLVITLFGKLAYPVGNSPSFRIMETEVVIIQGWASLNRQLGT